MPEDARDSTHLFEPASFLLEDGGHDDEILLGVRRGDNLALYRRPLVIEMRKKGQDRVFGCEIRVEEIRIREQVALERQRLVDEFVCVKVRERIIECSRHFAHGRAFEEHDACRLDAEPAYGGPVCNTEEAHGLMEDVLSGVRKRSGDAHERAVCHRRANDAVRIELYGDVLHGRPLFDRDDGARGKARRRCKKREPQERNDRDASECQGHIELLQTCEVELERNRARSDYLAKRPETHIGRLGGASRVDDEMRGRPGAVTVADGIWNMVARTAVLSIILVPI